METSLVSSAPPLPSWQTLQSPIPRCWAPNLLDSPTELKPGEAWQPSGPLLCFFFGKSFPCAAFALICKLISKARAALPASPTAGSPRESHGECHIHPSVTRGRASQWLRFPSSGRGALETHANPTTPLRIHQRPPVNTRRPWTTKHQNPLCIAGWCEGFAQDALAALINAQSLPRRSLRHFYLLKKNVRHLLTPAHFRCGFYFPRGHRQWQASPRLICVWSHLLNQGGLKLSPVKMSHYRALRFPW